MNINLFSPLWKIIHLETRERKITPEHQHKKNYNRSLALCMSWFLCSFFLIVLCTTQQHYHPFGVEAQGQHNHLSEAIVPLSPGSWGGWWTSLCLRIPPIQTCQGSRMPVIPSIQQTHKHTHTYIHPRPFLLPHRTACKGVTSLVSLVNLLGKHKDLNISTFL